MSPKRPEPDDPNQSRRFIEIAKTEGADKDEPKEAIKKIAPSQAKDA